MGMSICKDSMKFDLAIFAGGLATRLMNTESRPKPLVDINGITLLSRLIISLEKTNFFKSFNILTCCESQIFAEILSKEIKGLPYKICHEPNRSGRIGAISNFLILNESIDNFFVCNGDTLFNNLHDLKIPKKIHELSEEPTVFLAPNDLSRNDYKKVYIENDDKNYFQNSGLIYLSRKWFFKVIKNKPKINDIDEALFSKGVDLNYAFLNATLLDAGTPSRLAHIRRILK